MLLGECMNELLITCNLVSEDKLRVIEELVELFAKTGIVKDKSKFCATIRKREELESTAIGDGVAIPHGRSNSVSELKVAFGKSENGVDFAAVDRKPVNLIFMIAAPVDAGKKYLQVIAKVARLLKSRIMKQALMKAETPKEVMELIKDFDKMLIEEIEVKAKEGRVIHKK